MGKSWRFGRFQLAALQNPVRGVLHGSAALLSIGGSLALVARSNGARSITVSAIYGLTLFAMFVTSAVYHSVPWRPVWKLRFQKLDHAFIYALVAATFTAFAFGASHAGVWVILGVGGMWALLALGVGRELIDGPVRRLLLSLQFAVVAASLPALWLTLTRMDMPTAILTVAGGACYLVGVLMFVNGIPRLAPGVFSHHEFFHVMVIVASLAHFVAVWRVVSSV